MELEEVPVTPVALDRLRGVVGASQFRALERAAHEATRLLDGRTLWTVNSTARGGGVAEMLQVLMSYVVGAGVDGRWFVIPGDEDFFAATKRLHNWLHGSDGDGGPLGEAERDHYAQRSTMNAEALLRCGVKEDDVVLLHDPQTAGMIECLRDAGVSVVWRCHIGSDRFDERVAAGWDFLRPFLAGAHQYVFTREAFVPRWMDRDLLSIIPPSIDPFSPKNQDLTATEILDMLVSVGLVAGEAVNPPCFTRRDGSTDEVRSTVRVVRGDVPIAPSTPLVIQVSRWDRLKDMVGVMRGFTRHSREIGAVLALVGPDVTGVSDDPEGHAVLEECVEAWDALSDHDRRRVLLISVPMDDVDENAAIVNALQRHAAVVVQKSLAEGFGLTVTEAMWKARPVVASAIGGIRDQIVDGRNGVLLADPNDLDGFGLAVERLLGDPADAARLGAAARRHVTDHFLADRHLVRWVELLQHRLGTERHGRTA